jgi:hypothetical protein
MDGRFERLVPRDALVDVWVAPRRADPGAPSDYVLVRARWQVGDELLELVR